jgi:Domain of unknown function (DUF4143)/AAA domain
MPHVLRGGRLICRRLGLVNGWAVQIPGRAHADHPAKRVLPGSQNMYRSSRRLCSVVAWPRRAMFRGSLTNAWRVSSGACQPSWSPARAPQGRRPLPGASPTTSCGWMTRRSPRRWPRTRTRRCAAQEPLLLDEWQEVPEVLGAVKRAVDDDPRPGRFLLTGSVEADLTTRQWPGTGRVVRLVLHGLTEREITHSVDQPSLLDLLLNSDVSQLTIPGPPPGLDDYVDLALKSGFPEAALNLSVPGRTAWLDAYLDHVVNRDVLAAGEQRDPVRLRRYLEVLGLSTAGLPAESTIYQAAGINQRTADAYDRILAALYLTELVPAWATNRLNRLTKRAKRYLTDPALALAAARVEEHGRAPSGPTNRCGLNVVTSPPNQRAHPCT